jgi:hypothetical protein
MARQLTWYIRWPLTWLIQVPRLMEDEILWPLLVGHVAESIWSLPDQLGQMLANPPKPSTNLGRETTIHARENSGAGCIVIAELNVRR